MPPALLGAMGIGAAGAAGTGAGLSSIGTLMAATGSGAGSLAIPAAAGAAPLAALPAAGGMGPAAGMMARLGGVLPTLQGTARTVGDIGVIGNALNPPSPQAMPSQILQGPTQLSKRGGQSSSDELMALLMRVLAERDNAGR